jgi:hypothetical protein
MRVFRRGLFLLFMAALVAISASGQVATTGSILGVVTDPSGAVVPDAKVACISTETASRVDTVTTAAGAYVCASLPSGFYKVEVTATGFSKAVLSNIKVNVALPTNADVKVEVGQTVQTVEVQAQATPVITSTAAITTTVVGRQIMELPLPTRNALDLAFTMPGAGGGGTVRYASFNDLPHGAISVSVDGVNVQDNSYKSYAGGSFYTYIQPRIDAVDEVTVSTAASGAANTEGAVQIQFVTKRGTNDWHGGGFEYFRNNYLNANTWFNNAQNLPRQILRLNQFGAKLGGPIKKDKLFIFGVWDDFRIPAAISRTRTVLKSDALTGMFTYTGTDGQVRKVNVLQLAGANGFRSTPDANILALMQKIDALRTSGLVGVTPLNVLQDTYSFNNAGKQRRYFPTTRLDWNISQRHSFEAEWYYQGFRSFPDLLNGYDAIYPGFTTLNGLPAQGGQDSNRHQTSAAWRWIIKPTMSNEVRYGENGGTVIFAGGMTSQLFPNRTMLTWPLETSPLSLPQESRRNTPFITFGDTLSWQKGKHTLSMGGNFSLIKTWDCSTSGSTPTATLGVNSDDPISPLFVASNFPAISTSDLPNAASLYALLTGRLSGVSGNVNVSEKTHQYQPFSMLTLRNRQRNFGLFAQDNFRLRPTLTVNYGVRWDYQGKMINTNGIYTMPQGGVAGLWDVSGVGNLFKPGTLMGQAPSLVLAGNNSWNPRKGNFAPSVGFAWSPNSENWLIKAIFGKGGAFRAGYAINFSREGIYHMQSLGGSNPGPRASAALIAGRDFISGSLAYDKALPPLVTVPTSFTFPLAMSSLTYTGSSLNWYDPSLKPPQIHSWSMGIQREIVRDTVLEVRYVGNFGHSLWRQYNLNEVNIFENGFLQEFRYAQQNYLICAANRALCTGSATGALRFDNRGLAGQQNLPIMQAAFSATATAWTSSTFTTYLTQGTAGSFANAIANSATYTPKISAGGFPANLFLAAPTTVTGGSWYLTNGGMSNYNALQVEVRRRMSAGLLANLSYTWSKGLTNLAGDAIASGIQPQTLRDFNMAYVPSPYDIRHTLKFNFLYELPFGPGKKLVNSNNAILSRIFGGWQVNGIGRIQGGPAFRLTSGRATVNGQETGVIPLVPVSQLQKLVKIVKYPDGHVTFVDPILIGSDGRATTSYLMTPFVPGQFGYNVYLYGPGLVRIDGTLAKKIRVTERVNMELRAEALNIFNISNFQQSSVSASVAGAASIQGTTFGRTTNYYQDFNSSQDPGGRLITLVFRINF